MAKDPYKYFRIEARELVDGLKQGVLDLEKEPSAENIARLLRLAHTLKGAARVVKLPAIAEGAHAIEDMLEPHRASPNDTPAPIDALLRIVDAAGAAVTSLNAPKEAPRQAVVASAESVRVEVAELDRLIGGLTEATARLRTLRASSEAIKDGAAQRAVHADIEQLGLELRQACDVAARLRLTPASHVFTTLEHAVRDAAHSLQKDVRFVASGGETRLDAHVLSDVADALLHVVRNAVAHGIETRGTVTLAVERSADTIVFSCRDDGRGIDVDALRKLAAARGAEPSRLETDEGVLALLLEGGMTTTLAVTDVSGRGVGLDVVRDIVMRLRGETRVTTRAGEGTMFELRVPVSLAAVQSLVVSSSGIRGTIPLDAVTATQRVAASDVVRSSAGDALVFEGRPIPFASLARLVRAADERPPTAAIVVRARSGLVAIGVDTLLGTSNAIIHKLPPALGADPTIAGASLDAEGNPVLAFDPQALVEAARIAGPEVVRAPKKVLRPILVVDDSLTTRMLEQSILESAGYDVDVATSAEDALEKANRRAYGAFVVDVEMPGMDGFAFVAQTRADPTLRDVPAVLVTSRNAPEDKARGRAVGAAGYIVKGEFDQALLLQTIREILD